MDSIRRTTLNWLWWPLSVFWLLGLGQRAVGQEIATATNDSAADQRWNLVWSDDFDQDGAPSPDRWQFERGFIRNEESQFYTDRLKNARVEDGCLIIQAHRERFKNTDHVGGHRRWQNARPFAEHTSASLCTRGKAEWTYGRIEVRAQVPAGRGVWPAIWMLGTSFGEVGWPKCGEIDIMEYVGHEPNTVQANVHMQKYNHMLNTGKGKKRSCDDPLHADFHLFRVDWYEDRLEFFFDDEKYFQFDKESDDESVWPFAKPHYLILNLAIGGVLGGEKGIDDSIFPATYRIDYVRVYEQLDH